MEGTLGSRVLPSWRGICFFQREHRMTPRTPSLGSASSYDVGPVPVGSTYWGASKRPDIRQSIDVGVQLGAKGDSMWKSASLAFCSSLVLSCGNEPRHAPGPSKSTPSTAETYLLPPPGTRSLIQDIEVRRDSTGLAVIEGKTLLPRRTKIAIDVYRGNSRKAKDLLGGSKTDVGAQGMISAGPFDVSTTRTIRVNISSYFNGPWEQPVEVIAAVGPDGTKLPIKALTPDDPEFPERGGHIEYEAVLTLPAPSAEYLAIAAVKQAKLFVKGKGQAVDTVGDIVKFFDKPGVEFYPGDWSATNLGDGKWKVSLAHRWGKEQKVANWEYDSRTGRVRYLDPEAKMLSWLPAE
jgi:hypothetical protein